MSVKTLYVFIILESKNMIERLKRADYKIGESILRTYENMRTKKKRVCLKFKPQSLHIIYNIFTN